MPFDKKHCCLRRTFKGAKKLLWGVSSISQTHFRQTDAYFRFPKPGRGRVRLQTSVSDLEFCPLFCWTVNLQD